MSLHLYLHAAFMPRDGRPFAAYITLEPLYHPVVERTQISLTQEQARRLRGLARKRRTSMAALIRDAVDRAYPPSDRADQRWSTALASVGGFRSGVADVSAEHDRELGEAFNS